MCELMTLACATALVAGSVASAADKGTALKQAPAQEGAPATYPMGAREAVNYNVLVTPSMFAGPTACACTYENGVFDGRDGQVSHLGGGVTCGAKAADDFAFCEGFIYQLREIHATLLTTTFVGLVKPKAEIWSDCNGCPFDLLYTFQLLPNAAGGLDGGTVVERGGAPFGLAPDGRPLRIVDVTFTTTGQADVASQNVALHGGVYWLSVYGQSDNLGPTMGMYDITFWGTTALPIKGKPAVKIDGICTGVFNSFNFLNGRNGACAPIGVAPGPNQWTSLADCCIGCTDLNFSICADVCKIINDNGEGRTPVAGGGPVGSTSQFAPPGISTSLETRSADDFLVQPCQDYDLCYVEGCVLTNCPNPGFVGVFEIYNNICNKPDYCLAITGAPGCGIPAFGPVTHTKIVDLGYTAIIDGVQVHAYRVEFHHVTGIRLLQGRQYWISIGVRYNFNANQRGYFCFNADCRRTCLIRWNEGRVLTRQTLDSEAAARGCTSAQVCNGWAKVGNDFAFLIAADGVTLPGPINSTPSCAADYNRDGSLNSQDIFDYLNAWFTGCP